jgi:hypothetical protein
MEMGFYFIRYSVPVLLACGSVGVVAILNHIVGPVFWANRVVEPLEVLAYSIRTAGPIVFSVTFMVTFYGIEAARDANWFPKTAFGASLVLLVVVLVLNVIFIPKLSVR